jgi:hypothetical protein
VPDSKTKRDRNLKPRKGRTVSNGRLISLSWRFANSAKKKHGLLWYLLCTSRTDKFPFTACPEVLPQYRCAEQNIPQAPIYIFQTTSRNAAYSSTILSMTCPTRTPTVRSSSKYNLSLATFARRSRLYARRKFSCSCSAAG